MSIHLLFLFFCLIPSLSDQLQGLWVKKHIGEVDSFYFDKSKQNGYVSTKKNIISSINLNDGTINWRQILPKKDKLTKLIYDNNS